METKYACWNSLKIKQIDKLAVMHTWQPMSRPAGRPIAYPKKDPLTPVDRTIGRPIVQKRKTKGWSTDPNRELNSLLVGRLPVNRKG